MAYFGKEKWRRRTVAALSVTLAASLSLGIFAACTSDTTDDGTDDEETTTTQTDTQKIRNGNFEFYDEMNDALADKRDFIASPTDWTFSSGSPTSDTTSGIIDVSEWQTLSASGSRKKARVRAVRPRKPARYRARIQLHYAQGYTAEETAEILGISKEAGYKLGQRAKQRLEILCREEGLL